ncbi:MAG: hypothetical protein IJC89_01745 [Clostridia bacterium]|nr:hypothetical protein [Clostridia bacterium]
MKKYKLIMFFAIILTILLDGCNIDNKNESVTMESKADKIISEMSLSEMIYQMMYVNPEAITGVGTVVRAGEGTKNALEKYPVGGIVYFSKNLSNRNQTKEMLQNTQRYSKIPLFLGVDEEGGKVSRLGNNPDMGTTKLPTMMEIGKTGNPEKAYDIGKTLAKDLTQIGFNMDFAPVADIIVNPENTEIGDRSFGEKPDNVALMVKNCVLGMENNGLSACIKHFPGHGSTYTNSHNGYSESTRTIEELRNNEFIPFKAGIDAGADFVMISHMTLVNATGKKLASTLSKEVITDFLKKELKFQGIVITDSFQMGAITKEYTQGEAAIKAVLAGTDMILMPQDIDEVHNALLNAVNKGDISKKRIQESVRKILECKIKMGIIK